MLKPEKVPPDERPPLPDRAAVNKWLEEWYNADTPREERFDRVLADVPCTAVQRATFRPPTHPSPPRYPGDRESAAGDA